MDVLRGSRRNEGGFGFRQMIEPFGRRNCRSLQDVSFRRDGRLRQIDSQEARQTPFDEHRAFIVDQIACVDIRQRPLDGGHLRQVQARAGP